MLNHTSRYSAPSALDTRTVPARGASATALSYLRVEGLKVTYVGTGETDSQAACIRTNHPVPPDCPLYLFEVTVVSKGRSGFIAVGFQTEDVGLSLLPGWQAHSYGYHGDDGRMFNGGGEGKAYGPLYTTGDVIGAVLCRADQTIRFVKNGVDLGVAFRGVTEERLYPCIGLRTPGEEVQLNLGRSPNAPFRTDAAALLSWHRRRVWQEVMSQPLPSAAEGGLPLLPKLVHEYLLHHRYWQTAAVLNKDLQHERVPAPCTSLTQKQSKAGHAPSSAAKPDYRDRAGTSQQGPVAMEGVVSSSQSQDLVATRQEVFELVNRGSMQDVLDLLNAKFGRAVWKACPSLEFNLKVSQFCELLRLGPDMPEAAVRYGQTVLAQHPVKTEEDEELLADAMSLLAYERPEACPCGHLMRVERRVQLAEEVDQAVLAASGCQANSALERLLAQVLVAVEELRTLKVHQALLLEPRALFNGS